jgi:O-antigen/teichoic acid export membrane protein
MQSDRISKAEAAPPTVADAGILAGEMSLSNRALRFIWPFATQEHLLSWTRTLSAFVSFQVAVQLLGLVSGLMIVRTMSKDQYAVYTVAGSVLGLLTLLSDLGVNSALLAVGGKEWQNEMRLGQLVRSALRLRWMFFLFSGAVGAAVFFTMARRTPAARVEAALIFLLLLCGAAAQLTFNTLAIVPRLKVQVKQLQQLDLITALVRFLLLLGAVLTMLNTVVAVAINTASALLQALVCRRWARSCLESSAPLVAEDRSAMLRLSASQMPNIIFYCFYSQLTIFIISLFGNAARIAEVGALTRLGALFGILTSVISTIVLPRFARAQYRHDLARKYAQVVGAFIAGAGALFVCAIMLPHQLVWLLGGKYGGSENLVRWIVLSTLIHSFAGLLWSMNSARGWMKGVWITIPVTILFQLLAAQFLDLSTALGAILFGSVPVAAGLPVFTILALRGMKLAPNK